MMQLYTNRHLAARLQINLAKWKRWSREFLSPDPLGGFQSGYARQYTIDEAFWVFLGGHLVSDLHVSIPEAKIVMQDLRGWLEDNGFLTRSVQSVPDTADNHSCVEEYIIAIIKNSGKKDLRYHVRGIVSKEPSNVRGMRITLERYTEHHIAKDPDSADPGQGLIMKNLFITRLLKEFVKNLGLPFDMFSALSQIPEEASSISKTISEMGSGEKPAVSS